MRKFLYLLGLILLPTCILRAEGGDNLILWAFEDPLIQEINGGSSVRAEDLVGRGEAEGLTVNGVRVKMTDSGGSSTYLNLMEDSGDWATWIELPGILVDESGKIVGTTMEAGPTFADISGYTLDSTDPSLSFMIELGNYSDDGTWVVLAVSRSSTLEDMKENGNILSSATEMQSHQEWTGGSYAVPEPSSGLLILMGAGLLALRRRRRAA